MRRIAFHHVPAHLWLDHYRCVGAETLKQHLAEAGMLTIPELLQTGQQITAVVYEPLALYLEVAFVYLLMNSALTVLQSKLEKRLSKHVQQRTN